MFVFDKTIAKGNSDLSAKLVLIFVLNLSSLPYLTLAVTSHLLLFLQCFALPNIRFLLAVFSFIYFLPGQSPPLLILIIYWFLFSIFMHFAQVASELKTHIIFCPEYLQ